MSSTLRLLIYACIFFFFCEFGKFFSQFTTADTIEISQYHQLANIYFLKVTNRSTEKRCEICSKLTIKAPE